MTRNRDDRHHAHSKFVTFRAKVGETEDAVEIRTHIRNITLTNKVRKDVQEGEPDWYDFLVIVGGTAYDVDERTFRRLMSCMSAYNS